MVQRIKHQTKYCEAVKHSCYVKMLRYGLQATLQKMLLPDSSAPAPVMQHPLHYPHGTLFMAPGPAGQTVGIPDSPSLKKLMLREYHNYMMIHERYNFDFVPASNSFGARALKWGAKQALIKKKEEELEQRRADRRLRKCASLCIASLNPVADSGDQTASFIHNPRVGVASTWVANG